MILELHSPLDMHLHLSGCWTLAETMYSSRT